MEGGDIGGGASVPVAPNDDIDHSAATYYDSSSLISRLLFYWMRFWVHNMHKGSFKSNMVHPLLKADRISNWHPVFSRHVSDGIRRHERAKYENIKGNGGSKVTKPYLSIILRAIFLTFGRRVAVLLLATILVNVVSVGMSILLKMMIDTIVLSKESYWLIILFALAIACLELFVAILQQNVTFYNNRLEAVMESSISITLFQHGLCHRRAYASVAEGRHELSNCRGVAHSWPCTNAACGENPLMCPARRYQNNELPPSMYTFLLLDTYALMSPVEALLIGVQFFSTLITAVIIIRSRLGANVTTPLLILLLMVVLTSCIEIANGRVYLQSMHSKDYRYSKTADVISNMNVITSMGLEDVGYNIINNSREDEVSVLFTRLIMFALNMSTMMTIGAILFLVIMLDYIKCLETSLVHQKFDVGALMTILFIVNKITKATEHLPRMVKLVAEASASIKRVEKYLQSCSPNYYHTSPVKGSDPQNAAPAPLQISNDTFTNDTVVLYQKATFAWYHDIEDNINVNAGTLPILKNLDFELKRGDVKIITGAQGCGKTSFIKSILGEMSLVSGSMVVAPLSTGMPIFYTSQEVWLPSASIRSIITFGYAFNEDIYWRVVAAVELLSDFNSWADGDSRVVSEKGYSLSGGQRVRLSLARALYAYLLFSKANESLDDPCCFLMCLDEPFNGLDSQVASSIVKNLFNCKNGLLIRHDLAVVFVMSKMTMEICFKGAHALHLVNIPVYELGECSLSKCDSLGSTLCERSTTVPLAVVAQFNAERRTQPKALNLMPLGVLRDRVYCALPRVFSQCDLRAGDSEVAKVDRGKAEQQNSGSTCTAYFTYFSGIGYGLCCLILLLTMGGIVLDNVNSLFVASWSDSMKAVGYGKILTVAEARDLLSKHDGTVTLIKWFSGSYVILLYAGFTLTAAVSMRCARKLHTFAINSMFFKGSDVISVMKSVGSTITFLTADFFYIDEILGKCCLLALVSFLRLLVQLVTMCLSSLIVIPLAFAMIIYLYTQVVRPHINSSNRLQCFMFDAIGNINGAFMNVIDGASLYRSYRRERHCLEFLYESCDEYFRIRFLKKALPAWLMIVAKLLTSVMIFAVTLIVVCRAYFTGGEIQAAQLALLITLSVELNANMTSFVNTYSLTERMMCSVLRFENYFLQGKFSLEEKFESMDETVLCVRSIDDTGTCDKRRAELMKRRKAEFCNFLFRRYRSLASTLFYRPRIDFLDSAAYLPAEHDSLTLKDVSVPQPSQSSSDKSRYILSNVTAYATAGDIIGIVGRTGAGKSTLLGVLQNIVPKRYGCVLLDGRDLNTIPRKVLRHLIGVLPQLPFIFKGWTLRRFLDPRMLYSDSEIMTALECCGLLDLVNSLPCEKPLDAIMVEDDVRIKRGLYVIIPLIKLRGGDDKGPVLERRSDERADSPGNRTYFSISQLRMLSFARLVLYRSTYRILLIDEPPSDNCAADHGGDAGSDSAEGSLPVYDLVKIYFKHCTTFIVAHDRRALRTCQHVWYMNNGAIERKVSGEANVAEYLQSFG
ncbi:ABC transporter family protein [Babesia caballi]|uniref:ABC transporter family protein n=1 Tax=Babesia caballi TaxID=5871 RepID=A0AAV4LLJ5_BABCB|nr:ABC transporter family protein [Babesia caballi]